jgi:hypothetical protein
VTAAPTSSSVSTSILSSGHAHKGKRLREPTQGEVGRDIFKNRVFPLKYSQKKATGSAIRVIGSHFAGTDETTGIRRISTGGIRSKRCG